MLLIEHRVNTLEHINRVPSDRGIEVDIRDYDGELLLTHDPFTQGERLEDLLAAYHHSLIIFNVKCDGLEGKILDLVDKYKIQDFFLLDVANPTFVGLVNRGVHQIAVRFSEFEPIEFALTFAGKADWVWIDCFTHLPLNPSSYACLKEHFRLCLVSPELQKFPREDIQTFREQLKEMPIDAVCTDYCEDWIL